MHNNRVIQLCLVTFLIGHFEATILEWNANRKVLKKLHDVIDIRGMQVNAMNEFINDMNDRDMHPSLARKKFDEAKQFIDLVIEEL